MRHKLSTLSAYAWIGVCREIWSQPIACLITPRCPNNRTPLEVIPAVDWITQASKKDACHPLVINKGTSWDHALQTGNLLVSSVRGTRPCPAPPLCRL